MIYMNKTGALLPLGTGLIPTCSDQKSPVREELGTIQRERQRG